MSHLYQPGDRAPNLQLARLVDDHLETIHLHALTARRRGIIIGVPGAFTPVCTYRHIPDFVAKADRLRAQGFDLIACVAPNDPWTVQAWAHYVDPMGKITFLSDGNLALARALRATVADYDNFLGETSTRYLMMLKSGVIERLTLEPHPMALTCTRPDDVLLIDA
jgi:peroxiredoxin